MFWNREFDKPFGTFFVEEEEEGRIDVYDSKERWVSYTNYDGDADKNEILNDLADIMTLKGLLNYLGLEYYDIIKGFEDAVNYARNEGYLDENDEPDTLYDNEWVNVFGDSYVFLIEML